ncbi:MAG: hypothetical protein AAB394_00240 [Patescibacteria group bacterium]
MAKKKTTIDIFSDKDIELHELDCRLDKLNKLENFVILVKQEYQIRRLELEIKELKNALAM